MRLSDIHEDKRIALRVFGDDVAVWIITNPRFAFEALGRCVLKTRTTSTWVVLEVEATN